MKKDAGVAMVYVNGVIEGSITNPSSVTNTAAKFSIGSRTGGSNPLTTSSLALWRISATAPSAEQIKDIYEAEKPLFQTGAKCALNGSSDSVVALAYDDDTELLHAGTTGGRSVFQGLRRVDETSVGTTEIAAQGGLTIEETA
jgi:hypothetical protein